MIERVFCVHLPERTPSALTIVSAAIATTPIHFGAPGHPSPSIDASVAPKPVASAAIDPGNAIQKAVQPLRKPNAGP